MATEHELRALLQRERTRNATPAAPTPRQLPALTPEMLLSASGAREVQYAKQLRGMPLCPPRQLVADPLGAMLPSSPTRTVAPPGPATSGTVRVTAMVRPLDPGGQPQELTIPASSEELGQLLWGSNPEVSMGVAANSGEVPDDLSGLWDHTVPAGARDAAFRREYQAEFQPQPSGAVFDSDDIQFASDDWFNEPAPPVSAQVLERSRWVVGREDPPARPSIARHATPVDGQVVSQIGSDGRFRAVDRSSAPPPTPAPGLIRALSRQDLVSNRRQPGEHGRSAPATRRHLPASGPVPKLDRTTIPTAWERMLGDDFD